MVEQRIFGVEVYGILNMLIDYTAINRKESVKHILWNLNLQSNLLYRSPQINGHLHLTVISKPAQPVFSIYFNLNQWSPS